MMLLKIEVYRYKYIVIWNILSWINQILFQILQRFTESFGLKASKLILEIVNSYLCNHSNVGYHLEIMKLLNPQMYHL